VLSSNNYVFLTDENWLAFIGRDQVLGIANFESFSLDKDM
jgi:hypothetical protein